MIMRCERGFTLIELMIVVAIIGILAAIAMPQYDDYLAKAQVTEAAGLIDGMKTLIAEGIADSGAAGCAKPTGAVNQGRYVSTMTFTPGGAAPNITCSVRAPFSATANAKVASRQVTYVYSSGTGLWGCSSDLPANLVPKGC